jgi:hypothetical protein
MASFGRSEAFAQLPGQVSSQTLGHVTSATPIGSGTGQGVLLGFEATALRCLETY